MHVERKRGGACVFDISVFVRWGGWETGGRAFSNGLEGR